MVNNNKIWGLTDTYDEWQDRFLTLYQSSQFHFSCHHLSILHFPSFIFNKYTSFALSPFSSSAYSLFLLCFRIFLFLFFCLFAFCWCTIYWDKAIKACHDVTINELFWLSFPYPIYALYILTILVWYLLHYTWLKYIKNWIEDPSLGSLQVNDLFTTSSWI